MPGKTKAAYSQLTRQKRRTSLLRRRLVSCATALALFSQTVLASPALAAGHGLTQTPGQDTSVPVSAVVSHYVKPTPETSAKLPTPAWPSGSAVVTLDTAAPHHAGTLPLTLAPPHAKTSAASRTGAGGSAPSKASVTLEPRSAA